MSVVFAHGACLIFNILYHHVYITIFKSIQFIGEQKLNRNWIKKIYKKIYLYINFIFSCVMRINAVKDIINEIWKYFFKYSPILYLLCRYYLYFIREWTRMFGIWKNTFGSRVCGGCCTLSSDSSTYDIAVNATWPAYSYVQTYRHTHTHTLMDIDIK